MNAGNLINRFLILTTLAALLACKVSPEADIGDDSSEGTSGEALSSVEITTATNPAITEHVGSLVEAMEGLGKSIESRTDYPGDHQWFYQVRDEYWTDVIDFLIRHE